MKNKKLWLFECLIFLGIGFLLFKFLSPMFFALTIRGDSICWQYDYLITPIALFSKSDHCWFIMSFFWSAIVRLLPEILQIHPQVWFSDYCPWFLFGIFYLFQLSIVFNFTKYFKNNKYFLLWLFITVPLLIGIANRTEALWMLSDDCWFMAYYFLPIFSILFFSLLEKNYVKNGSIYPPPKFNFLFLSNIFLFIGVAFSHEYSRFILCSSLFIGYILHFLLINKNLNHLKNIIIYAVIVILNSFTFFLQTYHSWIGERLYKVTEIQENITFFLSGYYKYFFSENYVLLFLIIFLLILSFSFLKNSAERKKITIFCLSTLISILLFPLLTMVGHEGSNPCFIHTGIRFLTKLYLYNLFLSLLGWFVSSCKINSIKIYTTLSCFLILLIQVLPIKLDILTIQRNHQIRTRIYILERIFNLYGHNHKELLYCYDINEMIPCTTLAYFLYIYDFNFHTNYKIENYKTIDFCSIDEDYESCNKKLIKFLKDKTGYELTEEEIMKQDFQKYYLPTYQ